MKTLSIQKELAGLRKSTGGILRPVDVVSWAAKHPKSALYSRFDWDDTTAGHQFRLIQARHIINVQVISVENLPTRMFVSVQSQRTLRDGGYHTIQDVLDDPALYAESLEEAKSELNRLRRKYRHIMELKSVWDAIDRETKPSRLSVARK